MNTIERTSYEELLTDAVLKKVRPYATKLANRTRGGLEADDLIQTAVATLLTRKRVPVGTIEGLLTYRIHCVYLGWVHGTNYNPDEEPIPFASQQDKYMATGTLPIHDGVKQLTVPNPVEAWEMPLDIERALHTLNAEERQLVKWRFYEELPNAEIGVRLGMPPDGAGEKATQMAVARLFPPILEKLRVTLAEYE